MQMKTVQDKLGCVCKDIAVSSALTCDGGVQFCRKVFVAQFIAVEPDYHHSIKRREDTHRTAATQKHTCTHIHTWLEKYTERIT